MPAIFEYAHTVTADEIDDQGHANNLNYLKWMLSAAMAHSSAQGWPSSRYHEEGAGWVVKSHHIEYHQPALVDQRIVVRTWIADLKRATSIRRYRMLDAETGALMVEAETNWAFFHYTRRTVCRVPGHFAESFEIIEHDPLA